MKVKEQKELTLDDMIIAWKEEHKKVYMTIIDGNNYIWRRIKRKEYSEIMAIEADNIDERIYERQIAIVKKVILNMPIEELEKDLEDLSGLAPSIADEVLSKSGFNITTTIEL